RNGVGETTLLKCLMGLLPVRSGEIRLRDTNIASLPPYARAALGIGYVPQGREIFPRLTVGENLEMGLATQKKSAGVPSFIFEMFPVLKDMLGRRGGDLSGGQQQQLAIGRAIAMRASCVAIRVSSAFTSSWSALMAASVAFSGSLVCAFTLSVAPTRDVPNPCAIEPISARGGSVRLPLQSTPGDCVTAS